MLEQQTQAVFNEDGHCGLDEMVTTHQQELALGQDEDTVSNDGIEEAAPTDLLCDDIFLLDSAVSMIDELVLQTAKAWNDRRTISNELSSPLQQDTAGWLGVTVPGAEALYTEPPHNIDPDKVLLCQRLSIQSSRRDIADGLLPWNSILTSKKWPLPPKDRVDYSMVSPTLQTQMDIRKD